MKQNTLVILKPDAVKKNVIGQIIARFEAENLCVVNAKTLVLSLDDAKLFYKEHQGKDFYNGLIDFMCSGKIMPLELEGENAIKIARQILGNTDPQKAKEGTIRATFGSNLPKNAVHGSDSVESAKNEIKFFFNN